jgi:hypothetical protein
MSHAAFYCFTDFVFVTIADALLSGFFDSVGNLSVQEVSEIINVMRLLLLPPHMTSEWSCWLQ